MGDTHEKPRKGKAQATNTKCEQSKVDKKEVRKIKVE
jgi:hypothetical protein